MRTVSTSTPPDNHGLLLVPNRQIYELDELDELDNISHLACMSQVLSGKRLLSQNIVLRNAKTGQFETVTVRPRTRWPITWCGTWASQ